MMRVLLLLLSQRRYPMLFCSLGSEQHLNALFKAFQYKTVHKQFKNSAPISRLFSLVCVSKVNILDFETWVKFHQASGNIIRGYGEGFK